MKFSNTTKCFYPEDIEYPSLPNDLIDVSQEKYAAAIEARASGASIYFNNDELVIIAPQPLSAVEIKAIKWESIKNKRDTLSEKGGYPVTVAGVVKWFHSDGKSKIQQLGLARKADRIQTAGGDLNTNYTGPGPGGTLPWKTMDGSHVLMTGALAQAIVDAAEQQDMALFAVASYHGQQLMASSTPETYDFSTGWPATYGV